jgi:hypothetical protein
MRFLADPRRRSIALLTGGAVLVFVLLGTLNWFNTTSVNFLNPETYGQTMALTVLEVLLFLLLLLLLLLLFRTVLKVYVGQGSSGVGARLRSRMVLGAVIITLMPAALMSIFSYLLLNRSLERWFSPDASQLRDDSTRVVQELVEYVASNARSEAQSVIETGAGIAPPFLAGRLSARLWQRPADVSGLPGSARIEPRLSSRVDPGARVERNSACRSALGGSSIGRAAEQQCGG